CLLASVYRCKSNIPLWQVAIVGCKSSPRGPFIEDWLAMSAWAQSTPSTTDDPHSILQQVWFKFQSHVALFFPFPLISDS
ncbi:hypothetical protein PAXRUDRAFT_785711, partial [Paxillus rubicundulus Ve08.2h10]